MAAHGTRTKYKQGCHCHLCKAANTCYTRRVRNLRPREYARHGSRSKYNLGCRCPECTEAAACAQRVYFGRPLKEDCECLFCKPVPYEHEPCPCLRCEEERSPDAGEYDETYGGLLP